MSGKNIILIMLFILIPFFPSSQAIAQDTDLLWKARALQAIEKLDDLTSDLKQNFSLENNYRVMIEFAYAFILSNPEIAVKATSDIVAYHLILNFGEDGHLDVAYIYNLAGELTACRIDRLPKNLGALLLTGQDYSDFVAIRHLFDTEQPSLYFSKSDPFAAMVME